MKHPIEPLNLALVGLGGHGHTIQRAADAAEHVNVVAVCDPAEPEVRTARERFGCEAPPSYEALLAHDDIEAVVLVTPNHLHRPQAEAALAAGLDVLVEKPIANTITDSLAIIEAAEAAGRTLMVGHNMRYGRATRRAQQALAAGRLGELVTFEIHFSADNTKRMPPDAWRLRPDQCPLMPVMQLGIHGIDLIHYLIGDIDEVYALARSVTTASGVIDSVCATLRLGAGPTGTLVSNYCSQVTFEYRITGTEGTLRCTPHTYQFQATVDTDKDGFGPAETGDYTAYDLERWVLQMNAFATSVRQGTPPDIDGWAGLQALAVVEALQQSAAQGRPVQVPSFKERVPNT